jgi:hypothetical protein
VEFLKQALAPLPEKHALRVVRADSGFFDQQLLGFFEQRGLGCIAVARLTRWLKREAAGVTPWCALDEHYEVGEFSLQLLGWDCPRRFVVIREQLRAERASLKKNSSMSPAITSAFSSPTSLCRRKKSGATTITGRTRKILSPN